MQPNGAGERACDEADRARHAAWQLQPINPADRMTGTELYSGVLTRIAQAARINLEALRRQR